MGQPRQDYKWEPEGEDTIGEGRRALRTTHGWTMHSLEK